MYKRNQQHHIDPRGVLSAPSIPIFRFIWHSTSTRESKEAAAETNLYCLHAVMNIVSQDYIWRHKYLPRHNTLFLTTTRYVAWCHMEANSCSRQMSTIWVSACFDYKTPRYLTMYICIFAPGSSLTPFCWVKIFDPLDLNLTKFYIIKFIDPKYTIQNAYHIKPSDVTILLTQSMWNTCM